MTARPIVGIVSHTATVGHEGTPPGHHVVARSYLRAVHRAGALPIVLPLVDPADVDDLLDRIDALVVTGGADVDPSNYGHDREPVCGPSDLERDATDLAFVRAAATRNLPTLCICRGVQVMNVAFGGTLVQHVDDHMRIDLHDQTAHQVRVEPGSVLAEITGAERLAVNSLHHQVIDRPGERVRVIAWNDDGHPEAIVVEHAPRMLGVQWHPEMIRHRPEQLALFEELIRR